MTRPFRRKWRPDSDDHRPLLGDLVKAKRMAGRLDHATVARQAGVTYAAARDVELRFATLAPEAAALAQWAGTAIEDVQSPEPITERLIGRSRPIADPRIAPAILNHIAQGQPLCRFEMPGMALTVKQIYNHVSSWLGKDEKFKAAYLAAKETAALMSSEQILDIAADVEAPEDIAVAEFQIRLRQQLAKTFNRKVFDASSKQEQQATPLLAGFGDALERLTSARRQAPERLPAPTLQTIDIPVDEPEEAVNPLDED